ncbi:hypothetical protein HRbin37_02284 [bacterium HR37]|jgi:uncharacterized membrane protein YciS (DUF1049 family)|nr:hypothetical protein HRbin37_02284 [bacterium HR37]
MTLGAVIGSILSFLFLLFLSPYAITGIVIALLMAIFVVIFLITEAITLSRKLVLKRFFCPFRKVNVEAKLRPSIFTYRPYDDVVFCSAFKNGKPTCKKKCLDLPELMA